MTEFSDRLFAPGSVVGLRSFNVDSLGRLTGCHHREVFRPGENQAECKAGTGAFAGAFALPMTAALYRSMGMTPPPHLGEEVVLAKPKAHVVGQLNCTCGYYAYFDGSNDYDGPDRVTAIIEGYGVTTIGTRGFRTAKAHLVALVIPRAGLQWGWFHRFARWLDEDLEWGPWPAIVGVLVVAFSLSTASVFASDSPWLALLSLLAVPGAVLAAADLHGINCDGQTAPRVHRLVTANYPGVPIYRSQRAALRAHPLTEVEAPSPKDDDFWTRGAA